MEFPDAFDDSGLVPLVPFQLIHSNNADDDLMTELSLTEYGLDDALTEAEEVCDSGVGCCVV